MWDAAIDPSERQLPAAESVARVLEHARAQNLGIDIVAMVGAWASHDGRVCWTRRVRCERQLPAADTVAAAAEKHAAVYLELGQRALSFEPHRTLDIEAMPIRGSI